MPDRPAGERTAGHAVTRAQEEFVRGPARWWLVAALGMTGVGGGLYGAHYLTADEASARSELRNQIEAHDRDDRSQYDALMRAYVDLARDCEKREIDSIRGK